MSVEIIRRGNPVQASDMATGKAITKIAALVVAQAKALAPVDKGALRNSIMYKLVNNHTGGFNDGPGEEADKRIDGTVTGHEALVGSALEYAVYQEFGTRYMKPQPFLRPAIALYQGQKAADVMAKIIKEQTLGPLQMSETRINFFA